MDKPERQDNSTSLTDAFCKKAKPRAGEKVTIYSDTTTAGLCLIVTETAKSFAVRYTLKRGEHAGTKRRMVLGPFPGKSVADYREWALQVRADAAKGVDAAAADQDNRKAASIAVLASRYLAEHASKKRSADMDRRRIEKYILPAWGSRKAQSITRGDVKLLLAPIEFGDRAQDLPARPYEAIGVLALVKKMFAFAIDAELVALHPCARMKIDTPKEAGERELSSKRDLRAFWTLTGGGFMPETYAAALRFQLLTGSRPGEAIGLPWSEIDLDTNEWLLTASRSKNKREHLIPLTAELRAIVDAQPRGSRYVFPALRGGRLTDKRRAELLDAALVAYAREGGKLERFTPHDLRRTAETAMAAAGVHKEHRDRVLNHVDNSVGGKHYNRHDFKAEKRNALEALHRWVTAALSDKPASNILKHPAMAG